MGELFRAAEEPMRLYPPAFVERLQVLISYALGGGRPRACCFAVLSGLASGERGEKILRNAVGCADVEQCTYVFSFFLFRALEQSGLYCLTEGLWDKWKDALALGLTTWPEDLKRQRSDCHACGSLPIYEFVHCFCGVKALEPGYRKILVKTLCTYVGDMAGKVSTPVGPVRIAWKITDSVMEIQGETPEGVPAEICSPNEANGTATRAAVFTCRFC